MDYKCKDCSEVWGSGTLADGSVCDDLHCRYCTGKECPQCGSNEVQDDAVTVVWKCPQCGFQQTECFDGWNHYETASEVECVGCGEPSKLDDLPEF
jgi:hypothetical protein